MKSIGLVFVLLLFGACGKDYDYGDFPRDASHYEPIINSKSLETDKPELKEDIILVNNDYPIHIALYKNNKFYYNLPNLGDGVGNWSFRDGIFIIDTNGKRNLFDVVLHVFSADPEAKSYKVRFRDRFGYRVLKLKVVDKKIEN